MEKKTFYCVAMTIYDNGRAVMHISTVEAEAKPESTFVSTRRADYYKDYFDTAKEAQQFYNENKQ